MVDIYEQRGIYDKQLPKVGSYIPIVYRVSTNPEITCIV